MKRRVNLDGIRRRAAVVGARLPAELTRFARAAASTPLENVWFHVITTVPRDLGVDATTAKTLVPFLRLGDGGFVAFWRHGRTMPIVHFDSEGGHELVAAELTDFLRRVARQCSGVPDLDDGATALRVPGVRAARLAALGALRHTFREFLASNEPTA